jgi:type I protein arginine methyltransferase
MSGYSVISFGKMIVDKVRMDAFTEALRRSIKPGSIVLDIGTGTGIFALLACRFGARKVYAVEPNEAIRLAREMAAVNGVADKIEFIQDLSTRITLPEKADVIVADLHGILPYYEHFLPSLRDARERLLKPDGAMIPGREEVWAMVAEAPAQYAAYAVPWTDDYKGLDMRAALRMTTNQWGKNKIPPDRFLTGAARAGGWDIRTLESFNLEAAPRWTAERDGTGHGLVVWFDSHLTEDVGFSNAPGLPEAIYGRAFFPWTQPVAVAAGDAISIDLKADLIGDNYIWRWDTTIRDGRDPSRVKAEFRQSDFISAMLNPAGLRKKAADHIPALTGDGDIDLFILSLMDGARSSEEIARQAAGRFPARFRGWKDALARVGELAEKYGR